MPTTAVSTRAGIWSAEAIAHAPHRLDDVMAYIVQFAPQPTDVDVDRAGAAIVIVPPNSIQDVFTTENTPRVRGEQFEQLVLLVGKFNVSSVKGYLKAVYIDGEVSMNDGRLRLDGCSCADSFHSGAQFTGSRKVEAQFDVTRIEVEQVGVGLFNNRDYRRPAPCYVVGDCDREGDVRPDAPNHGDFVALNGFLVVGASPLSIDAFERVVIEAQLVDKGVCVRVVESV